MPMVDSGWCTAYLASLPPPQDLTLSQAMKRSMASRSFACPMVPFPFLLNASDASSRLTLVSPDLTNLNRVAGGFLLNKPFVYDSNLPPQLISSLLNVQAVISGEFLTRQSATNITSLRTKGGVNFVAYSKNEKWNQVSDESAALR